MSIESAIFLVSILAGEGAERSRRQRGANSLNDAVELPSEKAASTATSAADSCVGRMREASLVKPRLCLHA